MLNPLWLLSLIPLHASAATRWVAPDFFVESQEGGAPLSVASDPDCRAHIRRVMCLVDPDPQGGEGTADRPCLPGGEDYAGFFEALHDRYPRTLQRMFCSLSRIYVEKAFVGTAYAGVIRDASGALIGAKMGIRKSVLDERLDLTTWASWKEQLSFGGETGSYRLTDGLPRIRTTSSPEVSDFLYFVVTHEFGHIFDFANQLNRTVSGADGGEMHPDSWGALSWITERKPKPENDFVNLPGLCFYWCGTNPLAPGAAPELYEGLDRSSFISTYATSQPWDDFADSLAYTLMSQNLGTTYVLETGQGRSYDIMSKLHGPVFSEKLRYIERFLGRTDVVYP